MSTPPPTPVSTIEADLDVLPARSMSDAVARVSARGSVDDGEAAAREQHAAAPPPPIARIDEASSTVSPPPPAAAVAGDREAAAGSSAGRDDESHGVLAGVAAPGPDLKPISWFLVPILAVASNSRVVTPRYTVHAVSALGQRHAAMSTPPPTPVSTIEADLDVLPARSMSDAVARVSARGSVDDGEAAAREQHAAAPPPPIARIDEASSTVSPPPPAAAVAGDREAAAGSSAGRDDESHGVLAGVAAPGPDLKPISWFLVPILAVASNSRVVTPRWYTVHAVSALGPDLFKAAVAAVWAAVPIALLTTLRFSPDGYIDAEDQKRAWDLVLKYVVTKPASLLYAAVAQVERLSLHGESFKRTPFPGGATDDAETRGTSGDTGPSTNGSASNPEGGL